jgi:hypothetical protein
MREGVGATRWSASRSICMSNVPSDPPPQGSDPTPGTASRRSLRTTGTWLGVGTALGAGAGAALGSVALGVAFGVGMGAVLGVFRARKGPKSAI